MNVESSLRIKIASLEKLLEFEKRENQQLRSVFEERVPDVVDTAILVLKQIQNSQEHDHIPHSKLHEIVSLCSSIHRQFAPPDQVKTSEEPPVNLYQQQQIVHRQKIPRMIVKKSLDKEDIEYRVNYTKIMEEANLEFNHVPVHCVSKTMLNEHVVRLHLRPVGQFVYKGGQYLHLTRKSDGMTRRYSIASVPHDRLNGDILEVQIRVVARGSLTNWLLTTDSYVDEQNTHFTISGPEGSCTYNHDPTYTPKRICMVGIGTGLSPLWAIVRSALLVHNNTTSEIFLFHVNMSMQTAYYTDELWQLQKDFPNFHYCPCVRRIDTNVDGLILKSFPEHKYSITNKGVHLLAGKSSFEQVLFHKFNSDFSQTDLYLCGLEKSNAALVDRLLVCKADPSRIFRDRYWK